MATTIVWEKDMARAQGRAQKENLPILLFFHNPDWIGCQQMDAVTYPDKKVIDFVNKNYIPLQIPFDAKPLSDDFNIKWTPVLITLGAGRQEHHRSVGFLDPDAFISGSLLGIGKYHFDNDRFKEALGYFAEIISAHSRSDSVPEAIFLRGVAHYKNTGFPDSLKEAYETLSNRFPENEWTKRAYPYRLL